MENKANILVVDDTEYIRWFCAEILYRNGYIVLEAKNGQEAIEKLKKETVDLVLLDLNMPGKDGVAVMAEIQKQWSHLPVVILSALGPDHARGQEVAKYGIAGYLEKPVLSTQLISTIEEIIGNKDKPK